MRNTQHSDVIRSDNALPNLNIGADPLALTVKNRNTQKGQINKRIMLKKSVLRLEYPLGLINIDLSLVYSMAIGGQTISTDNYCQT